MTLRAARTILFYVSLPFFILGLSRCAYIVVYCDGATAACGATSAINAMTPVQVTVPISAIPSI
jgi:hypothetical protein